MIIDFHMAGGNGGFLNHATKISQQENTKQVRVGGK